MGFNNLSTFPALSKTVARIFARVKFSNIECDAAVTSQKLPTSGDYLQLFTGEGGVELTPSRNVSRLGDQQRGDSVLYQDDMTYKLSITVAMLNLDMMQDLLMMDPSETSAKTYMLLKQNRGIDLTDKAVSFIIYDKTKDPSNDTNVPDIDCDSETIVIFKACPSSDIPAIQFNAAQRTAKLTFECLVSTSSGSSSGCAGIVGPFTALT